jgi:sarcosine oxidase, subunit beta
MQTAEVVIAGAGIAGIATAWQLAERHGVTDVVLVDPRPPLTLTSNRTGANYRDWWPTRPIVELARRSIELMRELLEAGAPFELSRRGYLYVSRSQETGDRIERSLGAYREAGAGPIRTHSRGSAQYRPATDSGPHEPGGADVLLDREYIRETFPHLSPAVTGAIHARNAGTLETVGLGKHLLETVVRRGARVVRGEVVGVDIAHGRVERVRVRQQEATIDVAAHHFVNAAGPFAGRVANLVAVNLQLINVLQQKVAIADPEGVVPRDAPFTISLDPAGTLPAGLHIKADTIDAKAVVKLGCAFNQKPEEPEWDPVGTVEFPALVLRAAAQLIPGLERYAGTSEKPLAHEAGYYTRTPDDLPLIGPTGCEGAWVVAGFAGYGAMVACAAGEIAAAWIAGTSRPGYAASFDPHRFSNPANPVKAATNLATGAL